MQIDIKTACERLLSHDNILIIAHQKPDGDTLGSAFALMWALESLGKTVSIFSKDGFPKRFSFIYGVGYEPPKITVDYCVTVDIASMKLVSSEPLDWLEKYGVDLAIDHHHSNTFYAKETCLDAGAPAACQLMYEVIRELGVSIDKVIATALYTGISTDTECFKYPSVTAKTHRIAADLIDCGVNHGVINKLLYDTKSMGMLKVDEFMINSTKLYFDDKCALLVVPHKLHERFGLTEDDMGGLASFAIRIEGVFAGITVRDKGDGIFRVSLRTVSPVNASKICENFGGGGHANAAGCSMKGDYDDVVAKLLAATEAELKEKSILR